MRFGSLVALAFVLVACGGETTETTAPGAESTSTVADTTTTVNDETSTTIESVTTTTAAVTTTTPPDPYTFDITIEGSTVTGGGRITVPLGETVTLRITSDVDDEVHIHGYDLFVDLEAGVTAEVTFPADIPGVVEIETHNSHLVIANLEAS